MCCGWRCGLGSWKILSLAAHASQCISHNHWTHRNAPRRAAGRRSYHSACEAQGVHLEWLYERLAASRCPTSILLLDATRKCPTPEAHGHAAAGSKPGTAAGPSKPGTAGLMQRPGFPADSPRNRPGTRK